MADIPEKQIKRLRALIAEAETALAATKELLVSLVGDDPVLTERVKDKNLGKVIEGVFDGQNMVGSDGKTYPVPVSYTHLTLPMMSNAVLNQRMPGSFTVPQSFRAGPCPACPPIRM